MDPIDKKWQIFYVIEKEMETLETHKNISLPHKKFRPEKSFVKRMIEILVQKGCLEIVKSNTAGYIVDINVKKFKKDFNKARADNEIRAHKYELKKSNYLPIFNSKNFILTFGFYKSLFNPKDKIFSLCETIFNKKLGEPIPVVEISEKIYGEDAKTMGDNYITEKENNIRYLVSNLNRKLKKDLRLPYDWIETKGGQIRFKIELLQKIRHI